MTRKVRSLLRSEGFRMDCFYMDFLASSSILAFRGCFLWQACCPFASTPPTYLGHMNQKRLVLSFLTLSSLKLPSLKTQQTAKTESFSLNTQTVSPTSTVADHYTASGTHIPDQAQPPPDRQGSHHHGKAGCLGDTVHQWLLRCTC